MGWARVRRGNLQEVHSWRVSFPSVVQVPPCLHAVQVPRASCQGLLHVAAPSREACAIRLGSELPGQAAPAVVVVISTEYQQRPIKVCLIYVGLIGHFQGRRM